MQKQNKFWDKIAKNYDKKINKKYKKAYKNTIEISKKYLNKKQKALDVGCGTGITTVKLAKYVKKMIAIDTSQKMIDAALKKSKNMNIDYQQKDLFNKDLDKYDVIFAFNTLHFLDNIHNSLERINSLLNKTGLFISVTDCMGNHKSFITILASFLSKLKIIPSMKKFTAKELEKMIKDHGFKIVYKKNLFKDPPNYYIVAKKN